MQYRRLGDAGLKTSLLSFGSWVTFGNQLDVEAGMECMEAARRAGVNFFDNAESYAGGKSESLMGEALRQLGWPRHSYLVSTKFYWGIHDGPNTRNTLNRKYLLEGIDASLERLGLEHVDLVYCHRPDPDTPVEETARAMSDMVSSGRAHYWGTSEWPAGQIRAAWEVAERHHLHKPVVEQPQYNLLHRKRVEEEYAPLYEGIGLGLTTWSPLSSGLLTGKYLDGIPEEASPARLRFIAERIEDEQVSSRLRPFVEVARSLGCSPAQLAIAWCAANPHVSSVITGASRPSQVEENMAALEVLDRLDAETMERLDAIFR
ncbi:MAG TPA: aldo/keto reductase [Acidimicrobiia bacterium]|nr:aldo/keto reductase [Acidimicrobiia bacterium]